MEFSRNERNKKNGNEYFKIKICATRRKCGSIRTVLELLEDFSSLANNKVIDQKLVWKSSLGWYASRYFYYSRENRSIAAIRSKWCSESQKDDTYYEELESLYKHYLDNEVDNVIKCEPGSKDEKRKKIERAYYDTKDKFIQAEFGFTND